MSSPSAEALLHRLPLPLAQLYRRVLNARTAPERHLAAYDLWETAVKLLGSVSVVAWTALGRRDDALAERLPNLTRPSLGHWWELVRLLIPKLAEAGDPHFAALHDLMLVGPTRGDLPRAAALDAVLRETVEERRMARTTVRLDHLFERLVRYHSQEIDDGAVRERGTEFHERLGRAFRSAAEEVLARLDVLAGRRLIYLSEGDRPPNGSGLLEWYELIGETPRRRGCRRCRRRCRPRLRLEPSGAGPCGCYWSVPSCSPGPWHSPSELPQPLCSRRSGFPRDGWGGPSRPVTRDGPSPACCSPSWRRGKSSRAAAERSRPCRPRPVKLRRGPRRNRAARPSRSARRGRSRGASPGRAPKARRGTAAAEGGRGLLVADGRPALPGADRLRLPPLLLAQAAARPPGPALRHLRGDGQVPGLSRPGRLDALPGPFRPARGGAAAAPGLRPHPPPGAHDPGPVGANPARHRHRPGQAPRALRQGVAGIVRPEGLPRPGHLQVDRRQPQRRHAPQGRPVAALREVRAAARGPAAAGETPARDRFYPPLPPWLRPREYMAPEQERGEKVDKSADVFSLGIVLAELALGRPGRDPFVTAGSPVEHDDGLDQLPDDLRELIVWCTDLEPSRRPQDARYLFQRFEQRIAAVP